MPLKKASPSEAHSDSLRQKLEHLYARRIAVNNLIRSLEDYSTCEDPLVQRGPSRGRASADAGSY